MRLQAFTGPQDLQVLNIQSQVTLESGNRQNKSPFAIALGDWFPLRTYFLSSHASPNDSEIVIVVIIIVIGEANLVVHLGGIIAQTASLERVLLPYLGIALLIGAAAGLIIPAMGLASGILL